MMIDATTPSRGRATPYRMVMAGHICPYRLKSRGQLERHGHAVDDHRPTMRAETDAFMADRGVKTTPQTFIGGERIGGNVPLGIVSLTENVMMVATAVWMIAR